MADLLAGEETEALIEVREVRGSQGIMLERDSAVVDAEEGLEGFDVFLKVTWDESLQPEDHSNTDLCAIVFVMCTSFWQFHEKWRAIVQGLDII